MSELSMQVEALLFALGRPMGRAELAKELGADAQALENAITELAGAESRGVVVVDDGRLLELRVTPRASALVERVRKDEFAQGIGKAGLEVLCAVLYRGPLTRAEIDFIRGVNSSQTLRTLATRGLLRRTQNPKDERSLLYEPTTELLAQLGVRSARDLPEYEQIRGKLAELEAAYREASTSSSQTDA